VSTRLGADNWTDQLAEIECADIEEFFYIKCFEFIHDDNGILLERCTFIMGGGKTTSWSHGKPRCLKRDQSDLQAITI
jgi:hypothetical protein